MEQYSTEGNEYLRQLSSKMGPNNADRLLSILGRDRSFLNAIQSTTGQEIMKVIVSCIQEKEIKWLQNEETPEDRAELNAYMEINRKFIAIINRYNKNKERFNKNVV